MRFFVGLHQVSDAQHFNAAFISVNRLRGRKSHFKVQDWIMDSGAFTEVVRHGGYRFPVSEYASHIRRFASVSSLLDTADSMAWSFGARIAGRNGNDWREAERFRQVIESRQVQSNLFI